jgi:uncharacterized protein YgiM (DUF1202 family)
VEASRQKGDVAMRRAVAFALFLSISVLVVATVPADQNQDVLYVRVDSENLRDAPKGERLGTLAQGTKMTVLETEGNWVKVAVQGWIWKASTTDDSTFVAKAAAAQKGPALELMDFETKLLPVNVNVSRFSAEAVLTLKVKNNTQTRIKAWKAVVIVKNAFGDVLLRARLTDGTADIAAGATEEASFSWEDNQFIDDEPYDKLAAYSKENLRLELTEVQLSQ